MNKNIKGIIFDLDNTLIERSISDPYRKKRNWKKVFELIPQFTLYEGLPDVFEYISQNNIQITIVSFASHKLVEQITKQFNIPYSFILSGRDIKKKPSPDGMIKAMKEMKCNSNNIISFGDSLVDYQAAKAANIKHITCLWGSSEKKILEENGCENFISNPSEIIDILNLNPQIHKRKNIKLLYDTTLSIKQNALKIGVSEKSIFEYMSKNDISGHQNNHNNRLSQLIKAKKHFDKKKLKPTIQNLSSYLGWSNKTVIKYQKLIENSVENGRKTPPFFTPKYSQLLKSVNSNQINILNHILRLYIPKKTFDCDLTYSIGNFFKKGIPQPEYKFDKYPASTGIKELSEIEGISDNIFESIVCDPPFIFDSRGKEESKSYNIIPDRFSCFRNPTELHKAYNYLIEQSHRTLKIDGILIFKCMPTTWNGKPLDIPFFVKNYCYDIGFEFVDEFILVAKSKIVNSRHHTQRSSLKNHSYFYVFRKRRNIG